MYVKVLAPFSLPFSHAFLNSNIAEFRDSMRSDYEHTVAEERALAREITTMNERFIAWETAPLDEDDNERVKVIARKPPRVSIVASTVNGAERYQRKLQAIQDKVDLQCNINHSLEMS